MKYIFDKYSRVRSTQNQPAIPSESEVIEMLRHFPARPEYLVWIRVVSAIGNSFPKDVALKILFTHFRDEKPNETEKLIDRRLLSVRFGSFVYMAKQFGWHAGK